MLTILSEIEVSYTPYLSSHFMRSMKLYTYDQAHVFLFLSLGFKMEEETCPYAWLPYEGKHSNNQRLNFSKYV